MFELYLDIQKQKVLDELAEGEVKGRWKSFVGKWYVCRRPSGGVPFCDCWFSFFYLKFTASFSQAGVADICEESWRIGRGMV